jgi:murein DD-endopeptidase MepM/ murein hydrolase activator NlpD
MNKRLFDRRPQPQLPSLLSDYEYSVEHGLTSKPKRSIHSLIVAGSLLTALPLAWWLGISNASLNSSHNDIIPAPSVRLDLPPATSLATKPARLSTQPAPVAAAPSVLPTDDTTPPALAIAEPVRSDWIEETIAPGDTLSSIFERHQLSRSQMHTILALPEHRLAFRRIRPGQYLNIHTDELGNVNELMLELSFDEELYVSREHEGFNGQIRARPLTKHTIHTHGIIESSLYAAAQKNGLPSRLILDMVKIFRWDIDFAQNIQPKDSFSVVYEEIQNDAKQKRAGEILAVEFINQGHTYRAVRYQDSTGYVSYYTPEGNSLRKAFLRTPVEYGTLTSTFGPRRHPVLNRMREHKGVDYAAPIGTPIMAAGDGVIKTMERQRGYGNVVILSHQGEYQTLYAHMSGFAEGLKAGQRVRQGTIIGYVGKSGLVTGPHLHYEFHVDGVHHDPLTVKLPNTMPLPDSERAAFTAQTQPYLSQLASSKNRIATQDAPKSEEATVETTQPQARITKPLAAQLIAQR